MSKKKVEKKRISKKKESKKEERGGFTLVELLAVIAILSLIVSIGMFSITRIIRSAKQKTYDTTKNEIEDAAGNYSLEKNNELVFVPVEDSDELERQCIKVKDLIEAGFLDNNVTKASYEFNQKVSVEDYIYIERNKKTKAIIQKRYMNDSKLYNICSKLAEDTDIRFDIKKGWAKQKTVNITYYLKKYNKDQTYILTYEFTPGGATGTKKVKNTSRETDSFDISENGQVDAFITSDGYNFEAHAPVTNIDNVGPKIDAGAYSLKVDGSNKPKNYEINIVKDNEVSVAIPVNDCNGAGTNCSGVNLYDINRDKIMVKVNGGTLSKENYSFKLSETPEEAKCGFTEDDYTAKICGDGVYNLVIKFKNNDVTKALNGKLSILFETGAFVDYVGNLSSKVELKDIAVFNNTIKLNLDPNGGTYNGDRNRTMKYGTTDNNNIHDKGAATKANATLEGWFTAKNGGVKVFGSDGKSVISDYWTSAGTWKYIDSSPVNVYAHWQTQDNNGPAIAATLQYYDPNEKKILEYGSDYYSTCAGTKDSTALPGGCNRDTNWFKYKPTLVFEITDPSGINEDKIVMQYNQFGLSSLDSDFTGSRGIGTNQDKALVKKDGKFYTNITTSGVRHIKLAACDKLGNYSYLHVYFRFDNIPPTIDGSSTQQYEVCNDLSSCNKGSNLSWHNSSPEIILTPSDSLSGLTSGATFKYNADNKSKLDTSLTGGPSSITYSNGKIKKTIAYPGNRYIRFMVCDQAENCAYKHVFFKYETGITLSFDVNATNRSVITNPNHAGQGKLAFNTAFSKVKPLSDTNSVGCLNNGVGCAGGANDNKYFGVSCMYVKDYSRVFTVSGLSVGDEPVQITYLEKSGHVGSAGGSLRATQTHQYCTNLCVNPTDEGCSRLYSTYDIKGRNFKPTCSGRNSFTGYKYVYTSPAGNVSEPIELYVQYTVDCNYKPY